MTATILPEIVQLRIRIGEPILRSVVSYPRPVRPGTTEDIEMFTRKGVFSSFGRAAALATVAALALTAVEPSMAQRRVGARATASPLRPAPAARPTSARGAAVLSRRRWRGCRGGVCRHRRHRARDRRHPGSRLLRWSGLLRRRSLQFLRLLRRCRRPITAAARYYDGGYGYRYGVPHYRGYRLAGW